MGQENVYQFNYYYGQEAEQFNFYRIPKALFTEECFKVLSTDAKLLYGLLLDRMSLSMKNKWLDEYNRVYIIFTIEEVMDMLGCAKQKAVKMMAELDSEKGIGLIERKRCGFGNPTIIYVKNFIQVLTDKKQKKNKGEMALEEVEKMTEDIAENEEKFETNPEDSHKYENQTLRGMKIKPQKVRKSNPNYTDINNTDLNNNINNSIYPINHVYERMDGSDGKIELYLNIVRDNIDYTTFLKKMDKDRDELREVDSLVDLMVETLCSTKATFKINGSESDAELVKSRILKIDSSCIEYILLSLRRNTTKTC